MNHVVKFALLSALCIPGSAQAQDAPLPPAPDAPAPGQGSPGPAPEQPEQAPPAGQTPAPGEGDEPPPQAPDAGAPAPEPAPVADSGPPEPSEPAPQGESQAAEEADPFAAAEAEADDPFASAEAEAEDDAGKADDEVAAPGPDDEVIEPEDDLFQVDAVDVVGVLVEDERKAPGSLHVLDEEDLARFERDDVHQLLLDVPGVYVRQEDGFGLRPNIALRGTNPERSKKVTLMEDGVLFGPAPYSAPAAYYFPLITRMTSVEVAKGASAIQYGPQTVGGSINLRTREAPEDKFAAFVDLAAGTTNYGKAHGYFGWGSKYFGFLFEGVHLQSDGFRELDGGGDTGFSKQEGMLKLRFNTDPGAEVYHRFELKVGAALEDSNETYVGITQADFDANPQRRYGATQLDRMEWWRTQGELRWLWGVGDSFELDTRVYRHDFHRVWNRMDRFTGMCGARGLYDRINAIVPDALNEPCVDLLRLQRTSEELGASLLQAGNDREFFSQGVQTKARFAFKTGDFGHELEAGARAHVDEIDRLHGSRQFDIVQGADDQLVLSDPIIPNQDSITKDERVRTWAIALHLADEVTFGKLSVTPGVRLEIIRSHYDARIEGRQDTDQNLEIVLAGLGVHYALTDDLGVLAGVHRGFTPVPAQASLTGDGQAEKAINYEAGVRYLTARSRAELIGFANHYSNYVVDAGAASATDELTGTGAALAAGVEVSGQHQFKLPAKLALPLWFSYTFTDHQFLTDIETRQYQAVLGSTQVPASSPLPGIPNHQLALGVGLARQDLLGIDISLRVLGETREVSTDPSVHTDAYAQLDATAYVYVIPSLKGYAKVDNITNAQPVVSHFPFGARTGRPTLIQLGIKWEL